MVSKINEMIVEEYSSLVKDQEGIVVLTLDGLDSIESSELRSAVRAQGADLQVTKNRLAQVALKGVGIEITAESHIGTSALMVGSTEAAIAASKAVEAIAKAQKDNRKIHFTGALLDGSIMGAAEAAAIPSMPDKDTVRAMILSAMSAPARMLATVVREIPASTARVVSARADQEDAA